MDKNIQLNSHPETDNHNADNPTSDGNAQSDDSAPAKNYLTMDISEFEELPFTNEGSLECQADPMPFFFEAFANFVSPQDGALIILPKSDMRTAMAHVLEKLGARVSVCSPDDSYNYMLNLIHDHESARPSGSGASHDANLQVNNDSISGGGSPHNANLQVHNDSISGSGSPHDTNSRLFVDSFTGSAPQTGSITILIGTVDSLRGLLKHSADISVSAVNKVLISDSYIPQAFARDLSESWGCTIYEHYTRPELGGLGAISCPAHDGYHVCRDLYIEIIDPETGLTQPDGKWGEIVATSLFKAKNPLIRYRTGDVSRYLKSDCDCGSDTPRIDRIRRRGAMD